MIGVVSALKHLNKVIGGILEGYHCLQIFPPASTVDVLLLACTLLKKLTMN